MEEKMKCIILILFTCIVPSLLFCDGTAPAGAGTQNDPYQIATLSNLLWLSTTEAAWENSRYFIQTEDINAFSTFTWNDSTGFNPIGEYISEDQKTPFRGYYDGNGHIIRNLTINRSLENSVGLFSWVSNNGTLIEDCHVSGILSGNWDLGGVVGINYSSSVIENCSADCEISGRWYVGGISGRNYLHSIIRSCVVNTFLTSEGYYAGGLTGYNYNHSLIDSCLTQGTITGLSILGGFAGMNYQNSLISHSSSSVNVTGLNDIGGFVGVNEDESALSSCYASGTVEGENSIGGFVGLNRVSSNINSCFSTGACSGMYNVGGFIGRNNNSYLRDCYSLGNASGSISIGGFCGLNYEGEISNIYVTGEVQGDTSNGAIIGHNYLSTLSNSVWNSETTNQVTSVGLNELSEVDNVYRRSSAQMQEISTYLSLDWDFVGETGNGTNDYWSINGSENQGYPYLTQEEAPLSQQDNVIPQVIAETTLFPAYPNPFNPETTIEFSVKKNETATLSIYNIKGQLVTEYPEFHAGEHCVIWKGLDKHGKKAASGVYLYKLSSQTVCLSRKMIMLK
jgi:hypothetical protein